MSGIPQQHRADEITDTTAPRTGRRAPRLTPAGERDLALARVGAQTVEYRMHGDGPGTVLVFHGGHMRAQLALGEDVFTDAGMRVLIPSRPGYGRTPVNGPSTGPTTGAGTVADFTDTIAHLCRDLGVDQVAAVVGISAGGRTALTMAARHPDLVQRVILQSPVGFLPWPDRRTRLGGRILFHPGIEAVTWALVRTAIRFAPEPALRLLTRDLSLLPVGQVRAQLSAADRVTLTHLYTSMRSGHGFVADMLPVADCTAHISQPALIIATRNDRSVPFSHARSLAAAIARAELMESRADSHMIWFAPDYPAITAQIRAFLLTDHHTADGHVNA
ncbi:alpha/beta fold hydrolase [Nonomuraea zeae]|uniref:Alpha/beta hydrolase n=1 Tax=Nonomuraea zeae TaxID=1642303 RepID=A0A5S4G287_9ACTN|nr:alpha/beta hydrolase [Nonomuraea zeae]TMR27103.1 alpha/beta hydrolase [Nonomuraea zeae]